MANKLIRAYWDCSYCDAKHLDGLSDICPNCGKQKSETVKYYMGSADEVLSDEDLSKAKIKREECDGQHIDWVCKYCDQLNNYSDETCVACGASRDAESGKYGDSEREEAERAAEAAARAAAFAQPVPQQMIPEPVKETKKSRQPKLFGLIFSGSLIGFVLLLTFLLWPIKEINKISGYTWERSVTVEAMNTYSESNWTLPSNARLTDSREEFYGYESVVDHYETRTTEVAEQVVTGYETEVTYQDNGNGTFTEIENQVPVYGTEYHTETYEEPVYRDEPVYKTKYYYEIDRWEYVKTYKTSGEDQDAYWSEDYKLKSNQRDNNREEKYLVFYSNGKHVLEEEKEYNEWKKTRLGDEVVVTRCRFPGVIYDTKYPDAD